MSPLQLTLVYLLAAVLGVVACRYLKLPPMLGYLAVGVVIGPNALALAKNADGVRHLGEFGVVFLMFVIGLEFNLPKLRAMRTHVFGLGFFQVLLTMLGATAAMLGLAMMAPTLWGMGWHADLGDTIQAAGGIRHPPFSRCIAGPIFYQHRHDAGLATGAGTLATGVV